ncbi:hypothetical protein DACRYDRAFT_23899 [Dacryopinax primogenitus]|uniref:Uncharacterized protein n=1 Tax=Dacryopinax primogenitus (strain DJM 731) TaxID=1858805 RepID=M5FUW3_DACPD|nr:uncharacterized protein DACRYDRAFT_23899 [Dacryopinax primogenitus]EJT99319.1 hypothetical protein DACRYDRAFT_23899 [Dacryopinax primogenitus]
MSRFSNVLMFSSEDPYNASITEDGIPRYRVRSTKAPFMNERFGAFETYDRSSGLWAVFASIRWDIDGDNDMVFIFGDEVSLFQWERTFSLHWFSCVTFRLEEELWRWYELQRRGKSMLTDAPERVKAAEYRWATPEVSPELRLFGITEDNMGVMVLSIILMNKTRRGRLSVLLSRTLPAP